MSIKKKYTDSRVSLLDTCYLAASQLYLLETGSAASNPADCTTAKAKLRKKRVHNAPKPSQMDVCPEKIESLTVVGRAFESHVKQRSFKPYEAKVSSYTNLEKRLFYIRTRSFDFKPMYEQRSGSRCSVHAGSAYRYWLEGEEKSSAGMLGRLIGSSLQ